MSGSKEYYVYIHHEIGKYDSIVYVGKGSGGRAWDVTRCRNENPDHQNWMKSLVKQGWLPFEWTQIVTRGLTEKEALSAEKELLHSIGGTKFNRQSGERNYQAKLTDSQAREIYLKRGLHKDLALEFGVSRSAVSMIKSGRQWRTATACLRN